MKTEKELLEAIDQCLTRSTFQMRKLELLKLAQSEKLDAYKKGMTDAAELGYKSVTHLLNPSSNSTGALVVYAAAKDFKKAILTARDNKKEI